MKLPENILNFSLLTELLDYIQVGIVVADWNGTVLWGNEYYSRLAKFDIRDYFGRDVREISQNHNVELQEVPLIDKVLTEQSEITEIVTYNSSDYILTTATPVTLADNSRYILYCITNYTQTMEMEKNLSSAAAKVDAIETQLQVEQLEHSDHDRIVIENREMKRIYQMAARLAPSAVSVMLLGESGVGKDVLARYIHDISPRKEHSFIHVNLGAIPTSLFESQLFGYEAGAFTGASRNGKIGLIELADKGTLFLDEIGELPLEIQAKLLQAVQDKEIRRVGGTESIPIDVRIISATNRDLAHMVENGSFRLDLYYRLNVVDITIPPLRSRLEDITKLALRFLDEFNKEFGTKKMFSTDVFSVFKLYPWPGNVRELRHIVENVVAISIEDLITLHDLPSELDAQKQQVLREQAPGNYLPSGNHTLKEAVADLEIEMIREALSKHNTMMEAAASLGIDNSTLSKKCKRYGI